MTEHSGEKGRQDIIAAVLKDHQWHHTRDTHCGCGFRTPLAQLAVEGYVAHVAALIDGALSLSSVEGKP